MVPEPTCEELKQRIEELERESVEYKKVKEALRESEKRFRELAELLPQLVYEIDEEGGLVFVNGTGLKIFGYTKSDMEQGLTGYQMFIPEDRKRARDNVRKIVQDRIKLAVNEYTALRKDGTTFPIVVYGTYRTHGDRVVGTRGIIVDITERKRAEEELKISRYHIAMINKILRHDLINDLSVVMSALRLYGETGEERLLEEASERAGKSVDLIRRMRDLEVFISSRRDLNLYNIGSTIKEVMKNYPSIQFTIEGRGQVFADGALSSVIDNIVSNALIHGKVDRIEIKLRKTGDVCEVRIADNGIGIPDDIKKRIFEENFVFGETARTGLGLYIVKNTIENYGGSVYVEDNNPKGAVFVLKLKCVK